MSFVEVDQSKQNFYDCYKIIDNIKTFWYCRCCEFSGCQTILDFLKNENHYYFICQFQDDFFVYRLHQIKKYSCYLIFYKDYFWNKNLFLVKNNHHNENLNFLFNLDV